MKTPPVCLTIAGSDSSGGAGIQADLKTFARLGCYGASVITAITAQNTVKVFSSFPIPATVVAEQLRVVLNDLPVSVIKIGMLASKENVIAVSTVLQEFPDILTILDPVIVSSSGHPLLEEDALEVMKDQLLPRTDLITPNLLEMEKLLGEATDEQDPMGIAKGFFEMGVGAVLLKGGHREGPQCTDVLVRKKYRTTSDIRLYTKQRIQSTNTHGTGCTLSSAIAAKQAQGKPMEEAILQAKQYLTGAIRNAVSMNLGQGNGPLNHFF